MSGGGEGRKKKEAGGEGSPMWVITFADLMSQLMCFFVLLLSFSDNDTKTDFKYVTRLSDQFTIQLDSQKTSPSASQNLIGFDNIVGLPQPNIFNFDQSVKKTSDTQSNTLSVMDRNFLDGNSGSNIDLEVQNTTREIQGIVMDEIRDGMMDVLQEKNNIIIRIYNDAMFIAHSTLIRGDFIPKLEKIRMILAQLEGDVEIIGHQDDNELIQSQYKSNWEYSGARASAVTVELLKTQELDKKRFLVTSYGDTRSLAPNTTEENRAKNRRVDVIIHQAPHKPISFDKKNMPVGGSAVIPPNTPLNQQPAIEKNNFQRGVP